MGSTARDRSGRGIALAAAGGPGGPDSPARRGDVPGVDCLDGRAEQRQLRQEALQPAEVPPPDVRQAASAGEGVLPVAPEGLGEADPGAGTVGDEVDELTMPIDGAKRNAHSTPATAGATA